MAIAINRSMRLPANQYFPSTNAKTGIALHHTVGGSAKSTFDYWRDNAEQVGTAYLIDRDGTIFEVFEPEAWAWQFGLPWPAATKIKFERRFIGIELASEGGLREGPDGKLYCFDRVSPKTVKRREEAFDCGRVFRGYRWFDRYENAQMDSLCSLVDHLCGTFDIERQVPDRVLDFYGDAVAGFEGVIGHTMVRTDKSDPAPVQALWDRLLNECRVKPVAVGAAAPAPTARSMGQDEVDALFQHNVQQINRMNVAAGSMVKGLVMELERNGRATYIRLTNPAGGGHTVDYSVVQGDRSLVGRIARALGFKSVTDSRLEVRSA
ncbi:MAG: N-acetylmuramoyl-L-alanine amidase [Gemmatimonadota bacterium]|nr:N-acetylmuramoyl-L-alanine amidase [Gemmatimonadota bacterium]